MYNNYLNKFSAFAAVFLGFFSQFTNANIEKITLTHAEQAGTSSAGGGELVHAVLVLALVVIVVSISHLLKQKT